MTVYTGIDWSENKHDVAFLAGDGTVLACLTIPHTFDGFLKLEATRKELAVDPSHCKVGLETAHNLIIDFLWDHGYTDVCVIPPSVVKSNRGRQTTSGARTDQTDAILIAEILRTDQEPRYAWHPDSPLLRQIRARVSLVSHLTHNITRLSNRLRSVLLRYYPAALHVFGKLTSQIALHFIRTHPTPEAAAALTFADFKTFAQTHRYSHTRRLTACFARLQDPWPQALPETVQVYQDEAVLLASFLLTTVQAKKKSLRELQTLFLQHPDAPTFQSLPGVGEFLGPALLAKFGEDRQRFPTPGSLQALAGTCPVTDWSGKRKKIKFRRACDREFRNIAQQWARSSLRFSAWAAGYWAQTRPRCDSNSHAYRCLANRWLAIAWKLWQTHQEYDESYHLRQRALRGKGR